MEYEEKYDLSEGLFRLEVYSNIRKITFSIGSDQFNFSVNQFLRKSGLTITRIERNEHSKVLYGDVHYVLYCTREGETEEKLWKIIHGLPVVVEFFV